MEFDAYVWGNICSLLDSQTILKLACTGNASIQSKLRSGVRKLTLNASRHFLAPSMDVNQHLRSLSVATRRENLSSLFISETFTGEFDEKTCNWNAIFGGIKELTFHNYKALFAQSLLDASNFDCLQSLTVNRFPKSAWETLPQTLTSLTILSREIGYHNPNISVVRRLPPTLTYCRIVPAVDVLVMEDLETFRSLKDLETLQISLNMVSEPSSWSFLPTTITDLDIRLGKVVRKIAGETFETLLPRLVSLSSDWNAIQSLSLADSNDVSSSSSGGFPPTLRKFSIEFQFISTGDRRRLLRFVAPLCEKASLGPHELSHLGAMTNLKSFEIQGDYDLAGDIFPRSLTCLSHINLTSDCIGFLPPQLTELTCSIMWGTIKPASLNLLPKTLKILTLSTLSLLEGDLKLLNDGLERLSITFTLTLIPGVAQDISHLTRLQHLTISAHQVRTPFFSRPGTLPKSLTSLEITHIETAIGLTTSTDFAVCLPNLTCLKLPSHWDYDPASQGVLDYLPPHLTELSVGGIEMKDLQQSTIEALPRSLKIIDFSTSYGKVQPIATWDINKVQYFPPFLTQLTLPCEGSGAMVIIRTAYMYRHGK